MKQVKIKLSYSEMCAVDYVLCTNSMALQTSDYAAKTVLALLLDFGLKKVKPHTYLSYDKTKSISLPVAVAYALIHTWQSIVIKDVYTENVIRKIVFDIEPKLK